MTTTFIFLNYAIFYFIFFSLSLLLAKFNIFKCPIFSFLLKSKSKANSDNLLLLKLIRLQFDR